VSVPGIVAQPRFSMIDRLFHGETLLNSINSRCIGLMLEFLDTDRS